MKQLFNLLLILLLGVQFLSSQIIKEFPIAVGSEAASALSAAFDGTNYLVPIQGDANSEYTLTAQFISKTGELTGNRIALNAYGPVAPMAVFDGTNYLVVWQDVEHHLYARFLSPSGNWQGDAVLIATDVIFDLRPFNVSYSGSNFFVAYVKSDFGLYGQLLDKSGNLIGSSFFINNFGITDPQDEGSKEFSMASDGTNYLIVWFNHGGDSSNSILGQFVGKNGTLVGNAFTIDPPSPDHNPVSFIFDGNKYVISYDICFNPNSPYSCNDHGAYFRFVSTSGTVGERFTLAETAGVHNAFTFVCSDGNNYLFTWENQSLSDNSADNHIKGRYYNMSGTPLGEEFNIFTVPDSEGKIPLGGVMLFDGNNFLVGVTKAFLGETGFSDGDVYGILVQKYPSGLNNPQNNEKLTLYNYPNPFVNATTFYFQLPLRSKVTLIIYDAMGKQLMTVIDETLAAGEHQIPWQTNKLTGGLYFYKIQTEDFSVTSKFVIQK
ncbi:MAG TPA: T9SS type A sorting domain-containing protein [Dysgonamonadaceae bacterium]|nr:T9SS type A sorting domain-containing protein [Dysgonamonadaceae bacterium]